MFDINKIRMWVLGKTIPFKYPKALNKWFKFSVTVSGSEKWGWKYLLLRVILRIKWLCDLKMLNTLSCKSAWNKTPRYLSGICPYLPLCIGFHWLPLGSVCVAASRLHLLWLFHEAFAPKEMTPCLWLQETVSCPRSTMSWVQRMCWKCEHQYQFPLFVSREFCSELCYACIFNEGCILLLWHIEIYDFPWQVESSAPNPLKCFHGFPDTEI